MVGSDLDLNLSSFRDRPFGAPLELMLDIPVPPSVNETRRIDHAAARKVEAWKAAADIALMVSGQYKLAKRAAMPGRFELTITLCERQCRLDADNPVKAAIDYLRRIELIRDDAPRFMRKLTVEWGFAPAGCRLTVKSIA